MVGKNGQERGREGAKGRGDNKYCALWGDFIEAASQIEPCTRLVANTTLPNEKHPSGYLFNNIHTCILPQLFMRVLASIA